MEKILMEACIRLVCDNKGNRQVDTITATRGFRKYTSKESSLGNSRDLGD